ncbi:MAG: hypothetical protein HC814_04805 [Rhodobacteraceae bacterium]|nr:hypothetical protein [Paracoccaceae bacterium]
MPLRRRKSIAVTAERYENMTKFMRVVTNGQPTRIFAVDAGDRYTFANNRAADEAGIPAEDMTGQDHGKRRRSGESQEDRRASTATSCGRSPPPTTPNSPARPTS